MSPSDSRYIVVCKYRESNTVRVVGPFETQEGAVEWAHMMRGPGGNAAWDYTPDVMQAVPR